MNKAGLCRTEKYRILHVCKSNIFAGAESVAIQIITNLSEQFDLAYCCPYGPIEKILSNEEIQFYNLRRLDYRELDKVVKEYKPQIIHAHDFSASVICSFFASQCRVISHIHQNPKWIAKWNLRTLTYRMALKRFSKVLFVSKGITSQAIFLSNVKAGTMVVGNPINVSRIKELSQIQQECISYDVLFVGRFTSEKDPLRFIQIIGKVKQILPHIRTAMIGEGQLYTECKQMIHRLELDDNIELLGFMDNPYGLMNSCKVICITSIWEGFGLVASEAKVLGKAVLATPVGGLLELYEKDCDMFCKDDTQFAERIVDIVSHGTTWNINRVEITMDNYLNYMQQIKDVYKNILLDYKRTYEAINKR